VEPVSWNQAAAGVLSSSYSIGVRMPRLEWRRRRARAILPCGSACRARAARARARLPSRSAARTATSRRRRNRWSCRSAARRLRRRAQLAPPVPASSCQRRAPSCRGHRRTAGSRSRRSRAGRASRPGPCSSWRRRRTRPTARRPGGQCWPSSGEYAGRAGRPGPHRAADRAAFRVLARRLHHRPRQQSSAGRRSGRGRRRSACRSATESPSPSSIASAAAAVATSGAPRQIAQVAVFVSRFQLASVPLASAPPQLEQVAG